MTIQDVPTMKGTLMTEVVEQRVDPIRPRTKRGETVTIVTRNRYGYQAGPDVVATEVTLGVATNLTRDGRLKAVRRFGRGDAPVPVDKIVGLVQVLTVSELTAEIAEKVGCEHRWPGGQPWAPWGSIGELRADLVAAGYGPKPKPPHDEVVSDRAAACGGSVVDAIIARGSGCGSGTRAAMYGEDQL